MKDHKTIIAIMVIAWLVVPTGTPDDVIAFFLIQTLGGLAYFLLLVCVLVLMWHYDITPKKLSGFIKRTIKKVVEFKW